MIRHGKKAQWARPLPDHGLYGVYGTFSKIFLEITSCCNNRCAFCVSWKEPSQPKGTMTWQDMALVCASIPDFCGIVHLHFGGEALIVNDLPERCAYIKKCWPRCRIHFTTTLNIDRGRAYIESLVNSGVERIIISCYGYSREEYAKIHGNDAFEAVKRNLSYLAMLPAAGRPKAGLAIVANTDSIAASRDYAVLQKKFIEFARSCGVSFLLQRVIDDRQGRIPQGAAASFSNPHCPCDVVWGSRAGELIVGWNLNILPCCAMVSHDIVLGNLREMALRDIFSSARYHRFYEQQWDGGLEDFPLCRTCSSRFRISSTEESMRFAAYQAGLLANREVYFWGMGGAWREYDIFFQNITPRAMLADTVGTLPEEVAGIPVLSPDAALRPEMKLPIVIFAHPPNNRTIAATIRKKYPWYQPEDLIFCPATGLAEEWKALEMPREPHV